jgi:hypothetical protein
VNLGKPVKNRTVLRTVSISFHDDKAVYVLAHPQATQTGFPAKTPKWAPIGYQAIRK